MTNQPAFEDMAQVWIFIIACQLAEIFVIPTLTFLGGEEWCLYAQFTKNVLGRRSEWTLLQTWLTISGCYGTLTLKNTWPILTLRRTPKKKIPFWKTRNQDLWIKWRVRWGFFSAPRLVLNKSWISDHAHLKAEWKRMESGTQSFRPVLTSAFWRVGGSHSFSHWCFSYRILAGLFVGRHLSPGKSPTIQRHKLGFQTSGWESSLRDLNFKISWSEIMQRDHFDGTVKNLKLREGSLILSASLRMWQEAGPALCLREMERKLLGWAWCCVGRLLRNGVDTVKLCPEDSVTLVGCPWLQMGTTVFWSLHAVAPASTELDSLFSKLVPIITSIITPFPRFL